MSIFKCRTKKLKYKDCGLTEMTAGLSKKGMKTIKTQTQDKLRQWKDSDRTCEIP